MSNSESLSAVFRPDTTPKPFPRPMAPRKTLYVGRLVLGSETTVEQLQSRFEANNVLAAKGRLVLALMPRRLLRRDENAPIVIGSVVRKVSGYRHTSTAAQTMPVEVRAGRNSPGTWNVVVPLRKNDILDGQLNRTVRALGDENYTTYIQPRLIRVYETTSREDALDACSFIDERIGSTVHLAPVQRLEVEQKM